MHSSKCFTSTSSLASLDYTVMKVFSLQIMQLRHRQVKILGQHHTVRWWSHSLNPGSVYPRACTLNHYTLPVILKSLRCSTLDCRFARSKEGWSFDVCKVRTPKFTSDVYLAGWPGLSATAFGSHWNRLLFSCRWFG